MNELRFHPVAHERGKHLPVCAFCRCVTLELFSDDCPALCWTCGLLHGIEMPDYPAFRVKLPAKRKAA